MTLIVGILCNEGVVVGADRAATSSHAGHPVVEQPTRKISIIDDKIILATSGEVGLGQRFRHVVSELQEKKQIFSKLDPQSLALTICQNVVNNFSLTYLPKSRTIQQQYFNLTALLAFVNDGKAYLVEFEEGSLQPEFRDENLQFVSLGVGQPIADPFLGFMRRVFFKNNVLNIAMGTFITAWTMTHAIDVNPGGINGMDLAILKKDGKGNGKAKMLSEHELEEHHQSISSVEEYLTDYRTRFSPADAVEIPKP
ncbi:MAG: hypothetical protein V3W14_09110 [Candidatus Neomarinimicrobiota bacterium]